jgi:hypothetical protein
MKTPCDKDIDLGQTTVTIASAVFTGDIMAHHPWHIAWDDTETVLIPCLPKHLFSWLILICVIEYI